MAKRYPMTSRITVGDKRISVRPVEYYGEVIPGHYMDKNGEIYAVRNGKMQRIANRVSGQSSYPQITIYHRGITKRKCISMHRLVAFTFLPYNPPEEIGDEWKMIKKKLPRTAEYIIRSTTVNHIDEDPLNYHPSNLEWMSGEANNKSYHKNNHQIFKAEDDLDIVFKPSAKVKRIMK